MTELFLKLLNMSISASWLVVAVLLLRVPLRKAPKWISCLLWGIVALRLLLPFPVQSLFSLIPSAQVIPVDIAVSQTPAIHSGIPAVNSTVNPIFTQQLMQGVDMRSHILFFVSGMWTAGVVLMVLYSVVTYFRLRWQVRASIRGDKGVYFCDDVVSPFILGTFFPRIYIPSGLDDRQLEHVLAHERAHIKRRDHWWKPLGFLLLSVYWFNPLLWVAYVLLCRDIERACDEKVIAQLDNMGKKSYSEALVACSVHRRTVMACPVAFGEVGVKARIKGIVRYKKPALWIVGVSLLACVLTAACFLTDPIPCKHTYEGEITVPATCAEKGMQTLTCKDCRHSYTVPVELLAHPFDDGVVTAEPTCTQPGSRKHTCVDCGAEKAEPIALAPHTAGTLTVTKEPNCTRTGEAISTCTRCQTVFVAQILETNDVHDLKQTVISEATCSSEGMALNDCTRCTYMEILTLEKKKHTYRENILTVGTTCGSEWKVEKKCTVCGYVKLEIQKAEHDEHTWVVDPYGNTRCTNCFTIIPYYGSDITYDYIAGTGNKKEDDTKSPVIQWAPNPGEVWVGRPPWV